MNIALLASGMGDDVPAAMAEEALAELTAPDRFGAVHVHYDAEHQVIQIPRAPAYNAVENPNQLVGVYRDWRSAPECELSWRHIACIKTGVNFRKASMAKAWDETFGEPEIAYSKGERLRSYVTLQERTSRAPKAAQGELDLPPGGTGATDRPSAVVAVAGSAGSKGRNGHATPPPFPAVRGGGSTGDPETGAPRHQAATESASAGGAAGGVAIAPKTSQAGDTAPARQYKPPPGID